MESRIGGWALNSNSEQVIPEHLRQWVEASLGPQTAVLSSQRLKGSTSSVLHRLHLQFGGTRKDAVVRQFNHAEWLKMEPDLARHEAAALSYVTESGLPGPGVLAWDELGESSGMPAVLMTLLPGEVQLRPEKMELWLQGLAGALVRIHRYEAEEFPWAYRTYHNISSLTVPEWSRFPEEWRSALELVQGPQPAFTPCFIHRDYHPANVLWLGGEVSGIVDWVNACRGPAGIDIGHCRLNLALLYGVAAADGFLSAYLQEAGESFSYDPYWDLLSLFDVQDGPPEVYSGWAAFGVSGLTDSLMAERTDHYLISLLKRVRAAR